MSEALVYIGLDGDRIGSIIELYLLEERESEVRDFSKKINTALDMIEKYINACGNVIMKGGDNIIGYGRFQEADRKAISKMFYELTECSSSCILSETLKDLIMQMKKEKIRATHE